MKRIAFLGYNKNETKLIKEIDKANSQWKVTHYSKKVSFRELKKFDTIISFGYQHKVDSVTIQKLIRPIINLHIGYLPYNRGAHPNFWSFVENTKSGVTIHCIDESIDRGKIIYQKQIDFDLIQNRKKLSFSSTYKILIKEIEKLFLDNIDNLINQKYKGFEQVGKGTFHNTKDLPPILKKWDQNIFQTVKKIEKNKKLKMKKRLSIIDEIESTRKNNNINWMNIVRNSLKNSPEKTIQILEKINIDDNNISNLFKKLTEK